MRSTAHYHGGRLTIAEVFHQNSQRGLFIQVLDKQQLVLQAWNEAGEEVAYLANDGSGAHGDAAALFAIMQRVTSADLQQQMRLATIPVGPIELMKTFRKWLK